MWVAEGTDQEADIGVFQQLNEPLGYAKFLIRSRVTHNVPEGRDLMRKCLVLLIGLAVLCAPAFAQQTGSVSGSVALQDGVEIPGVLITATADILPQARTTVSNAAGDYRLPQLPPGRYQLTFTMDGMGDQVVALQVLLGQNSTINVTMGAELSETLQVTSSAALIDSSSAELKTAIADEVIEALPVGQQYRDIVKLIPGVQYTENEIRGPSAGGSGQDNVYQFDGVNVNLPLFGTLSAEPASYDIDQISIVKGGAKAQEFNRSGGFTINTVSKSGTNRFKGLVSYQLQSSGMTGNLDTGSLEEFDEDRDWTVFNIGGPAVKDKLFFYGSYYRPTRSRSNVANAYGAVPDFDDERDEIFGKLTFTPTEKFLLNASLRTSDREQSGSGVGEFEAASRSTGAEVTQDIAILEGTWVVSDQSFVSFKLTDYEFLNSERPDTMFNFPIGVGPNGTVLDVNNLDRMGSFGVPTAATCGGDPTCLAAVDDLISRYGYLDNGVLNGGGFVGGDSEINIQNYFRESYEVAWDRVFGSGDVTHELHVGYQSYEDAEELNRTSNGWGIISFFGGVPSDGPEGTFYEARVQQAGTQGFPSGIIRSEYKSQNFEINDTIKWNDWSFNIGVLASNDELFGQGLRANPSNVSGFELASGNPYKMYEIDWEDMIQPRLGAIWNYDDSNSTVFVNYARYNPAASSLPRAASWARNELGQVIQVFFDADGNPLLSQQLGGSSGKFFQPNMDPRSVDEYLIGTARQFGSNWTTRAHLRHRYASNFWEDTNNNGRSRLLAPAGFPQEDYIPELGDYRAEVGGSSYVIAELDGAFNKYYEASLEAEYRTSALYVRGSYVWSHFYGNFDQDNASDTAGGDVNTFIGSSLIADFAGRQVWNDHYGDLRGDRRHQLKLYGYHNLDWDASVGAYAIFQSGQPWEIHNPDYYRCLDPVAADRDENCRVGGTGSSSAGYRFGSCLDPANGGPGTGVCPYPAASPAGSFTSGDHWQLDVNYTQNFPLKDRYNVQLRADVFNLFDNQTGYSIEPDERAAGFGEPRSYFKPQRFQLALRFEF